MFSGFGGVPIISGSNVAFTARYNSDNSAGIFTGTAGTQGATTIADLTTTATGQSTPFLVFLGLPVLSGGNVAFSASYNSSGGQGIFTGTAGVKGATTIADPTTVATGQSTAFYRFLNGAVISGNNVAFLTSYNAGSGTGIFTGTAGVKGAATIADYTTVATGQSTVFSNFPATPAISGSNVVFRAIYNSGSGQGLFTGTAGTPGAKTLADLTTIATGQTTPFALFNLTPVISGSNVAFRAGYNGGSGTGIFTGTAGIKGALTLADYTTVAPGRGTFSSFSSSVLSISGSNVAFTAVSYVTGSSGSTGNGLYLSQNGTLFEVAAVGEPLFGSTISTLGFSPAGLDGNTLTYSYTLANGVSGVGTYTAVPEPATWLAGALTLAFAVRTLRRRVRRTGKR